MPALLETVLAGLFPVLVIIAALRDLTSYTIPNWISLAMVAAFAALAGTAGLPLPALGVHLAVGAAALVAGMALFALGWIGGGDAKLLAAACLWFGWPGSQAFLLDTVVAGGALALALVFARGQLSRVPIPGLPGWALRLTTPGEPAPYGVAIAIGALADFPASEFLRFVHTSY